MKKLIVLLSLTAVNSYIIASSPKNNAYPKPEHISKPGEFLMLLSQFIRDNKIDEKAYNQAGFEHEEAFLQFAGKLSNTCIASKVAAARAQKNTVPDWQATTWQKATLPLMTLYGHLHTVLRSHSPRPEYFKKLEIPSNLHIDMGWSKGEKIKPENLK